MASQGGSTPNPTREPNWVQDPDTGTYYDANTGNFYQNPIGSDRQQQQRGVRFGFGNSGSFHVDFHF